MKLAIEAWQCVSSMTIANCWKHLGILLSPSSESSPTRISKTLSSLTPVGLEQAIQERQTALGRLSAHVIAMKNVASVEELVENATEVVTEKDWDDDDIIEHRSTACSGSPIHWRKQKSGHRRIILLNVRGMGAVRRCE
jgi:hypothetical protein